MPTFVGQRRKNQTRKNRLALAISGYETKPDLKANVRRASRRAKRRQVILKFAGLLCEVLVLAGVIGLGLALALFLANAPTLPSKELGRLAFVWLGGSIGIALASMALDLLLSWATKKSWRRK